MGVSFSVDCCSWGDGHGDLAPFGMVVLAWGVLAFVILALWARFWRYVRAREGLDEEAYVEGDETPRGGGSSASDVIREFPQGRTNSGHHDGIRDGRQSSELSLRTGRVSARSDPRTS